MDSHLNLSDKNRGNTPRIGIDAQIVRPPMSGVESSTYNLIEHLCRETPEYEYVIYHPPGVAMPPGTSGPHVRLSCPRLPTSLRPVRIFWQHAFLPVRLRRDRVNLLHAPAYTAPLAANVPVVLTIHDTLALKFPNLCKRLNSIHYGVFMPPCARRAARIIVPSECTRRDVINILNIPPGKVRVIPWGVSRTFRPVEDKEQLARVRAELGLPERYILYTGNIEPKKNLPVLIEAFATAHKSGRITHRLVIAGRKGWRHSNVFRTVRDLGIGEFVRFLGYVPHESLAALYSGASVFAFPSLYEGFGLPPLEAMACGTPVVTTTAGALPEVVGSAALTVPPESVRELRIAIEKVLANQFLSAKLRELGLKRAGIFSWKNTARRTVEVYHELLFP